MYINNEKWFINTKTGDFNFIMNTFGVTASTARLLINRGKLNERDIREFLYPDESMLHPQSLLRNLKEAADVIEEKLSSHLRIRVIGDYDADGIMSTYILTHAFKRLGAEADFYIPDRVKDGYGINADMIERAAEDGVDTIVTCDNGIAAVDAGEAAERLGITLIITDHHELQEELPKARVIVDPKQPEDTYPCKNICGAVVAAKLAAELLERKGLAGKGKGCIDYIEFMAIATVCDVVPLDGENRTVASLGLKKLNSLYIKGIGDVSKANKGLKALVEGCKLDEVTEYSIGFVIGPCLNATGRLDLADKAMRMLCAEETEKAHSLARECRELNEERKAMTIQETEKAFKQLEEAGSLDKVLVVELPECHESLAGIIAGRIKEKYMHPVFVLTKSGDIMKGSGRSITGYNMFGEMQKVSGYFLKYGGHPMAAGLSIKAEDVAAFRTEINKNCTLTEDDMKKKVMLDAAVALSAFDEKSIEEIKLFSPCGTENPSPVFGDRNNSVIRMKRIGKNSNYLKFTMEDSRGVKFEAVCFKDAADVIEYLSDKFGQDQVDAAFAGRPNSIKLTISYVPEINEYNGGRSIQMKIQGLI